MFDILVFWSAPEILCQKTDRTRERDAENQKQTAEIFALSPHSALLQWHLYIEFMHGEWNCVLFYNAVPCITVIVLIL